MKYAKDLKLNEIFQHDELKGWQVLNTPELLELTVKVAAKNIGTGKVKTFEFGQHVELDIIEITPLKQGDNLTIIGRRWFDRVNGNTYFSAVALVNGVQVAEIPFEYGYGNQYEESIYNLLFKLGYCADREIYNVKGVEALWSYCSRKGITKYVTHSDVNRKKDL